MMMMMQESLQASWSDVSQTGCNTSQCMTGQPTAYPHPAPSCDESILPSQRHLPSRFQATDDSPVGKSQYTLLSSPSAIHHGQLASRSSYLHAYNYSDLPLGVEKANRSKVLPNEVRVNRFLIFSALVSLCKCFLIR